MQTSPSPARPKIAQWFLPLLIILFLVFPFGYAAIIGEAGTGSVSLNQISSAIGSVACTEGLTPVVTILLFEIALFLLVVVSAFSMEKRASWVFNLLREQGIPYTLLLLLVTTPFIIAWQTDSSVCERGTSYFWQSIFAETFILAALAISYNLIFGFAGVISFGHSAFFGVGAYAVGLLMLHLEWPIGAAILATLIISISMGLLVSVIALRIHGLYFAIFTLVFAEIFFVLAQNRIMAEITGAEDGFTFNVPDWINATKNRLAFYYLALVFLIFCYLLVKRLVNSPTGRIMNAIRDNEDRALMLGYNTFVYKTLAIVLAGVMASGAGILRALLNKGASPNVLGVSFTIDPLIMTLVGGAGTFSGPVIGAFLIRLVEQSLRDTILTLGTLQLNIGEYWFLILGLLFILMVIVFPSGIVGTVQSRWQRWQARRRKKHNKTS